MSGHGPETQIQFSLNFMFQCSNTSMNFHRSQAKKIINEDMLEVNQWKYQVSELQRSEQVLAIDNRCYLDSILSL